jgi:hypothetical protein
MPSDDGVKIEEALEVDEELVAAFRRRPCRRMSFRPFY